MHQYDFTLKFALARHDADPESFIERLVNEGCDDALAGIGKSGRIALTFTREDTGLAEFAGIVSEALERSGIIATLSGGAAGCRCRRRP